MHHKHHVVPVHAGGSNDKSNIVSLTIIEHAAAHFWLWLRYRRFEDRVAWQGLSGMIDKQEAIRQIQNRNGTIAIQEKLGIHNPSNKQRVQDGRKAGGLVASNSGQLDSIRTPENCAKGGSVSGRNNIESGHLAKIRSQDNSRKGARTQNSKQYTCSICGLSTKGGPMSYHFKYVHEGLDWKSNVTFRMLYEI